MACYIDHVCTTNKEELWGTDYGVTIQLPGLAGKLEMSNVSNLKWWRRAQARAWVALQPQVMKPTEEGQPQMVRQGQSPGKHTNHKRWTQFLFFLLDGSFLSFQNLEEIFNMFVLMGLHLCVYVLMYGMCMWMCLHLYVLVQFSLWYTPNVVHPVYEIRSLIPTGTLWLHQACWPASHRVM